MCVCAFVPDARNCDCYDHLEDWCPRFVKGVLLVNFSSQCAHEQTFFFKLPIRLFLLPSVKARQKKKNILCFICIPVLLFWFTIAFLSFGGGALERFVAAGSE